MKEKFMRPDFTRGNIKLVFESGEVCIYANADGLKKLMDFCNQLLTKSKDDHMHLEDYDVLTGDSLRGVIALFK
jgi:hypothetical protein